MFYRMAKTVEGAPVAEGGIAGNHAVFFAHQYRIAHQGAGFKPGDTVVGINGGVVPDGGGMQHRVVIDLADGGAILFTGVTDNHRKPQVGMFTIVVRYVTILHKRGG